MTFHLNFWIYTYPFDIIIYKKMDLLFLPCFSVIFLSQWFVQRYIQVTSYYGMLLVSYFVLGHPERELLKAGLLKLAGLIIMERVNVFITYYI